LGGYYCQNIPVYTTNLQYGHFTIITIDPSINLLVYVKGNLNRKPWFLPPHVGVKPIDLPNTRILEKSTIVTQKNNIYLNDPRIHFTIPLSRHVVGRDPTVSSSRLQSFGAAPGAMLEI